MPFSKVQKTSKGDVKGNTACTPLGNTYTTSTGGKIPLGCCSKTPVKKCPNYLFCPIYHLYYAFIFL